MPYAKVNDINMYYEIHGEGEPIVLNSGAGGRVESQEIIVNALSSEYRVIAYEVRGSGRTDSPDIPFTWDMLADDLAGLLDALDIGSVHIFGESLGSVIATFFTLRHPDKVTSLILASSSPGGAHTVYSKELMALIPKFPEMTPEERAEAQIKLFITPEYIENNPDYVEKRTKSMLASATAAAAGGFAKNSQSLQVYDVYDRLPEIGVPTLVVHGEADIACLVDNGRVIASRIPSAELVTFPGTGHLLLEAGDEPYRVMLDFLNRHSNN